MVGLLPDNHQISWMMRHGSFYLIGMLVILWSVWLVIVCRDRFRQNLRQHYPALILAVCLTGLIFYNSPPRFKVLADEANLMGVSMMMHHSREAALPLECLYTEDNSPVYNQTDSKRPFLFPFMVSLLHSIFGYSPFNGFVLNFFVSICVLFGIYLMVINFRPKKYGLIAMTLMAGSPIYMICSTSGGFEPLNLMMVIYCIFLFTLASKSESSPRRVEFLFFSMLLLAHCRYESIIFIPIMGLLIIPFLMRQHFFQNMSYFTVVIPVFFLPILWQRKFYMGGQALINRLNVYTFERVDVGFTIKDFVHNFDDNIFVLMGVDPNYGFSAIVFALALIGIYLLVQKLLVYRNQGTSSSLIIVNISVFFILFVIISAFHWGNFGLAMDNRLSLVFLPFIVWAAVYCLSRNDIFFKKHWIYFVGFLSVLHFIFFLPYGKREQVVNSLALPYEYQEVSNYLNQHFPDSKNTLIITEQPNLYIIQKYAGIQFTSLDNFLKNRSRHKEFKDIVAVHKIINSTKTTSHERWGQWQINAKPLIIIPVSREYFIQVESWQVMG